MANSTQIIESDLNSDEVDMDFLAKTANKYHLLYETQTLCDVTLIAGIDNRRVSAHRAWLAAANPYFHVMFTGNFADKEKEEITLSEIHGNELQALIDFCYTGRIDINETNAFVLLQTASRMEFVSLESKCADFLRKTLSVSNCLSICAEIEPFINFKELLNIAWTFIDENFIDVVGYSDEFLKLNVADLLRLLKPDNLNVWSEEQVFHALVKWVEHDAESRNCHVPELLAAIRLTQLRTQFLVNDVGKFCEKFNCFKAELWFSTVLKRPSTTNKRFIAIGGDDNLQLSEIYSPTFNKWEGFSEFKCEKNGLCSLIFNEELYIFGGISKNGSVLASGDKYNFATKELKEIEPMKVARYNFGATVANDYIYVAGGESGLSSVERYHPETGKWYGVPSMLESRSCFPLIFFNQRVFAVGGSNGGKHLSSVEYFDDYENNWEKVSSMNRARDEHAVFVHNDRLYAVGGCNGYETETSVEYYDSSIDTWSYIETLTVPRRRFGLIYLNDFVIIAGGRDNDRTLQSSGGVENEGVTQSSVIRINLKTNEQESLASMRVERSFFGLLQLPLFDPDK